jgi:NodT family efflux transporter outer membrane factor (OMF) lipoprotein
MKIKRGGLLRTFTMTAFVVASSCAVGPDYVRPAAPAAKGYTKEPLSDKTAPGDGKGGGAQKFAEGMDVPGQWWTLFHSQELNAVINRALKANPSVQQAEAALRVARENVYAQQGAYYPEVGAGLSASRQQVARQSTSQLSTGETLYSLHTAQVTVSYAPDVFGLNRRQVESLEAQAESQRFQYEAAILTLTSNIVVAAVQEASLRGQIAATEELIKIQTEQLDLTRRQFELGAVPEAAVVALRGSLAQTISALPPLRKQLALQRDLLTALCGGFPSEELAEKFELSSLELPRELPVSLPSRLVEQRPDVRSAEEQLHSASAQIGVAQANRLPQFTINAGAGYSATTISGLFNGQNNFWSLAGGLTQPIFEGGTLLHRKKSADAAYDQAAALYRATVVGAFQNVADTLRAIQYDGDSVKTAEDAERATRQGLDIAQRQAELGDISHLAFLSSTQAYQQAVINLVQSKAGRLADTAALFQALGGGWWNRVEVDAKSADGRQTR